MKTKSFITLIGFIFILAGSIAQAQMPNYFGTPAPTQPEATSTPTGDPKTGAAGGLKQKATSAIASGTAKPTAPLVPLYDPYMDNHLKAPAESKSFGLFGQPVSQVEALLRYNGAKNHSYAFGKYSRLVFSVYLITLYFDKERKLGGFLVEPRAPYKTVEPGARAFFMDTFLKGADLSKFAVTFASDRLEIQYKP